MGRPQPHPGRAGRGRVRIRRQRAASRPQLPASPSAPVPRPRRRDTNRTADPPALGPCHGVGGRKPGGTHGGPAGPARPLRGGSSGGGGRPRWTGGVADRGPGRPGSPGFGQRGPLPGFRRRGIGGVGARHVVAPAHGRPAPATPRRCPGIDRRRDDTDPDDDRGRSYLRWRWVRRSGPRRLGWTHGTSSPQRLPLRQWPVRGGPAGGAPPPPTSSATGMGTLHPSTARSGWADASGSTPPRSPSTSGRSSPVPAAGAVAAAIAGSLDRHGRDGRAGLASGGRRGVRWRAGVAQHADHRPRLRVAAGGRGRGVAVRCRGPTARALDHAGWPQQQSPLPQ